MRPVHLLPPPAARPTRATTPPGRVVDQLVRENEMGGPVTGYFLVKRGLDCFLAAALLVLSAPVMLAAMALVKLTSRGPMTYTQTRVGFAGRPFTIYKIRTMIHNCESLTGPRWSIPGDPRVTALGRFLRATHLDELPQLVNVLRGDMNLIGPRPERPEFLADLQREVPNYTNRLAIRPGVTGLAQIQLPADTDLDSVRRKLAYDLFYIHRVGPWLDLRILICTAFYAVGIPYHALRELFRIPTCDVVERHAEIALAATVTPRQRLSA